MDPEQLNENGYTLAMELAIKKQPIDFIYGHDPSLLSRNGKTVADILKETGQIVPLCWQIRQEPTQEQITQYQNNKKDYLKTIKNAYVNNIEFLKNPYYKIDGTNTFLSDCIINQFTPIIPNMLHSPYLRLENGRTCAMLWVIYCNQNIPRYLRHDPTIQDDYGYTVSMLLKLNYGHVDQYWEYRDKTSIKTCHGLSSSLIERIMKEDNNVFI